MDRSLTSLSVVAVHSARVLIVSMDIEMLTWPCLCVISVSAGVLAAGHIRGAKYKDRRMALWECFTGEI